MIKNNYYNKTNWKNINKSYNFSFLFILVCGDIFSSTYAVFIKWASTWGFSQWFWSLLTLFIMYYLILIVFNKMFSKRYEWVMSIRYRLFVLFLDALVNIIFGMLTVLHPELFPMLTQLMIKCPIALSPFILCFELTCLILFLEWVRAFKH